MNRPVIALASSLVIMASCSGQPQNQMPPAQNAAPSAPAAPPAAAPLPAESPADGRRARRFAECAEVMQAMASLYDAIAAQRPAEGEPFRARAAQRRVGADLFEREARNAGLTSEAVRELRAVAAARIAQEESRREFSDFMRALGREADRCAALVEGPR